MKFTFTCTDGTLKQTYSGFQKAFVKTRAYPLIMAVAEFDGNVETWFVDGENLAEAVSELGRYYRSEHGFEVRIAVYRREGIYDQYGQPEQE